MHDVEAPGRGITTAGRAGAKRTTLMRALQEPALPVPRHVSPGLDRALGIALGAYGLMVPWSTAGTSLAMGVLLVLAILCASAIWSARPWREPVMAVGLVLLAWITLHTLVKDGPRGIHGPFMAYKELLVAPILFALLRITSRPGYFFRGLAAATLLYAAGTWVGLVSETAAVYLLPHRISASYEFAVVAFLAVLQARHSSRPAGWIAVAAFLSVTVLFALDGRTGQVLLLLLLPFAAWLQSPKRWRVAATIAVPLLAVGVGMLSSHVQKRVAETAKAIEAPNPRPTSSSDIRMELVRHGLRVARENWLLGGGYRHYAELHQDVVRRTYANDPQRRQLADTAEWARTTNPHDEYLMQLAGGGIVSLGLFLAWLALPVVRRVPEPVIRHALAGLVVAFAIGCLFNSLLLDFVEGHFTTALLAWLLARASRRADGQAGQRRG